MRHRRRIDHADPTALYLQLADIIREKVEVGVYAPGELLPPARNLAQEYEVSHDTVREAMAVLRREGLIYTRRGQGSRVRQLGERRVILVGPGVDIVTRMPTEAERRELDGLPEGIPVIVLSEPGQEDLILRGGPETVIRTQAEEPEEKAHQEQG